MSQPEPKPSRFNAITRMGFYVFAASALIWVGGEVISAVKFILPWTAAIGVIAIAFGIYTQYKKPAAD